MRFYVAARTAQIQKVRQIYDKIKKRGHHILYDWTQITNIERPFDKNPEITKKYVGEIVSNIRNSDVFIMLTDKEGTDMYGELTTAIAFNLENLKPEVFVLGDELSHSIFPFHPIVNIRKSIEEILDEFEV